MQGYHHFLVNHSVGKFINGMASTNGIEGMWASVKIHTWDRIKNLCRAVKGKRLTYNQLIAE